ncbi:MAG: toxin-antitoxin system YwqK family antitoxin [Bacteroidales bacterium]|nr:toxin-antitoxin system YwqK family antitoxin [Bacteroidales bacterium]
MNKTAFIGLLLLCICYSGLLNGQSGYQVYWYENDSISSEGTLRDGKPDGYWKTYYESGQLKSEGNRKDFLLDGLWLFYSEDGDTTLAVNYLKDLKQGIRKTYLSDEILEEQFDQGIRVNMSRCYDRQYRLLQVIPIRNGYEDGLSPIYDTTGRLIEIISYKKGFVNSREVINRYDSQGRKHGYWKAFYPNFDLKWEQYYKHGLRDGFYKEYDEKGNLKVITKYVNDVEVIIESATKPLQMQHEYYPNGRIKREASFRDGKREGTWREFDENGNVISSQIYQNGRLVQSGVMDTDGTRRGEWVELYPDSTLRAKGFFINGKRSGEWRFYYPGEILEQLGNYKDGKLDGTWTWYDLSGKIQKQEDFLDGVPEGSYIEYDELGNCIAKGNYFDGLKTGRWKEQSGETSFEGEYRNGHQVGEWVSYYANGKMAFKGSFKGGYPDGEHLYYYPNGRLREVQSYSGGIRNGVWKKFLDTGELFLEERYEQDKDEILRDQQ